MSFTGEWVDNNGASYFINHIGSDIWYCSEAKDGTWRQFFNGVQTDQTTIKGMAGAVPTCGQPGDPNEGSITFTIKSSSQLDIKSSQMDVRRDGKVTKVQWLKKVGPGFTAPAFQFVPAVICDNAVTGGWIGKQGDYCYVRQSKESQNVWFFSAHPASKWTYVFKGTLTPPPTGSAVYSLKGKYAMVPRSYPVGSTTGGSASGIPAYKADQLGMDVGSEDYEPAEVPPPPLLSGDATFKATASADGVIRTLDLQSGSNLPGSHFVRTDANAPVKISFESMKCVGTNEISGDEPYGFLYTGDLSSATRASVESMPKPVAPSKLYHTKVFSGVTSSSPTLSQPLEIWGVKQVNQVAQPAPIDYPEDVLILAAMMEQDYCNLENFTNLVEDSLIVGLTNYMLAHDDYSSIAANLSSDMNTDILAMSVVDGVLQGAADPDDQIGVAQPVRLTRQELDKARFGPVTKTLSFAKTSSNNTSGSYTMTFKVQGVYV